ncbi:hypothetical protein [Streptomyces sp. NPDC090056]|uniref:hypothetical protein n=1 Tax=Streptomyces sp. NPDC090056 TaxID=3365934 RepID=UPI00382EB667
MLRISTPLEGGPYSKYAESIAPDAEKLVRNRFGSLPTVHLVLNGDSSQADHLMDTAEAQLLHDFTPTQLNSASRPDRRSCRAFAQASLDSDGVLIVLQIPGMSSERDVARNLVHGLVHAHQIGDRSARSLHLDYLNHVRGQQAMQPNTLSAYGLLIEQREIEAHDAEDLATQL